MGKKARENRRQYKKLKRELIDRGYKYRVYDQDPETGELIKPKISKTEHLRRQTLKMYADHRLDHHKEWWKHAEPFIRRLAMKDVMKTMQTRAADDMRAHMDREVFGSIDRNLFQSASHEQLTGAT